MNVKQMMKQAQQMQERMQRELAEMVVEASVGGGMVTVRMSGHKQLLGVTLEPDVLDPKDPGMLQDLILSAVNEAARSVCGEAIQVHGGIGFTWEFDLHLYFKRAKHLEPLYGDTEYHRERVLQQALASHGAEAVAAGA